MAIPEEDDAWGKTQIGDLLENCVKDKSPLPDCDETRRWFQAGQARNSKVTVGEWLDAWEGEGRGLRNSRSVCRVLVGRCRART